MKRKQKKMFGRNKEYKKGQLVLVVKERKKEIRRRGRN